jgi:hypothetical protein
MPLSWTISHPQRLVIAVAKGEVAPHEFGAYIEAMQSVGSYRKMFVVRGMSTVFDAVLMKTVGDAARTQAQRETLGPIAIVAETEPAYQSAVIYGDAARDIDRPIRIFRELHEARRWLDGFAPAEASATG